MNQCAKCGKTTEAGQLYRFHYGVLVEPDGKPTPDGKPACPLTTFREMGSEEVYYCDRSSIEAQMRAEKFRIGLWLVSGLAAALALAMTFIHMPMKLRQDFGVWLILLLVIAGMLRSPYLKHRRLRAALRDEDPDRARQAVNSNLNIQDQGDLWAIALRQQALIEDCRRALQEEGTELFFLTRSLYEELPHS